MHLKELVIESQGTWALSYILNSNVMSCHGKGFFYPLGEWTRARSKVTKKKCLSFKELNKYSLVTFFSVQSSKHSGKRITNDKGNGKVSFLFVLGSFSIAILITRNLSKIGIDNRYLSIFMAARQKVTKSIKKFPENEPEYQLRSLASHSIYSIRSKWISIKSRFSSF